ncbi:conserved hypothetical protein [Ruegeria lacuscaerulensis ITI-1157]|nr:conserved hypothetical protein [Ruegeria lacuscaerulensis ITI-1157]SHJ19996.1 hypothetical protein SAMN05444404_1677 [Ruegeria lacuscaerulensis ITI-1157]
MMGMGGEGIVYPTRGGTRSGGGGRTGVPDGLREAQRLYNSTRTEAEKYAAEVERINELHRLFPEIVTEEVRDRAIGAIADGVNSLSGATDALNQTFSDLFLSIGEGSEAARCELAGLLDQMARLLLQSANAGFGSGGFAGALLGGLGIPEFATGTNFAPGGPALVGECGPEIVNLSRGSQVIPNHKIGQGGAVSHVLVELSPGLEAQILRKSAVQSVQITKAGMARVEQNTGTALDNHLARKG